MPMNISMQRLAAAFVGIIFICAIGASVTENTNPNFAGYAYPWTPVSASGSRMGTNLWDLVDWPGHLASLKTELEHNRAEAALPQVKLAVGNSSIDMFGYMPGVILLNDFHYTPRPMPINFGATTKMLMERNAEFYRNDATAPAFLLANIGQIDGRFAPQDDALALPEVLERYQPVLAEGVFCCSNGRRAGRIWNGLFWVPRPSSGVNSRRFPSRAPICSGARPTSESPCWGAPGRFSFTRLSAMLS